MAAAIAVAVAGVVAVAVLAEGNRNAGVELALEAPALNVVPLWHQDEVDLVRPVADGPYRPQALSLTGTDESARKLLRWNAAFTYASRYRITMELATAIHDAALAEKIEPELAFRLVRLESRFNPNAVSSAGAIGLTQLMLGTARYYQPGITPEDLTDPSTNLHIGFRYLRSLIRDYRGDLRLALLAYNRGPTAVLNALAMGEDPGNGYGRILMRGYTGTGVID